MDYAPSTVLATVIAAFFPLRRAVKDQRNAAANASDTTGAAQTPSQMQRVPGASAGAGNTPSRFMGEPPSGFDSFQLGGESQNASSNTKRAEDDTANRGNGLSAAARLGVDSPAALSQWHPQII